MVKYYQRNGEIHIALNDNKIVGAAIWNRKGMPFFSLRSILASGMLGTVLVFLLKIRLVA